VAALDGVNLESATAWEAEADEEAAAQLGDEDEDAVVAGGRAAVRGIYPHMKWDINPQFHSLYVALAFPSSLPFVCPSSSYPYYYPLLLYPLLSSCTLSYCFSHLVGVGVACNTPSPGFLWILSRN